MFIGRLFRVWNDRHGFQKRAQVLLSDVPSCSSRPFDTMPEFGNGYGSNFELVMGAGSNPPLQVEGAFLSPDHQVRVKNYRHELAGTFRTLRATLRSRCH